ncbi:helix-turn-helix domain-containing protein [Vibrio tarriae]|uniref:helix-turn-helix domain-containing protein n=1 Tax=Vibrio tarriae TaxID=2014742 RepID=UPI000DE47006|nr:helix-turn-helix transcriptional regulator [Vibrio tarriae]RBM52904.1 XRE family transcriptional regulator [Vibrio tarriae]
MSTPSPLPTRLKEARTRAGISQKTLGIRIGMDPSVASGRMNHYEKGRHTPDINTLRKMAEELNVPIAFFFCDSPKTAQLLCLIENLSEEEKSTLIQKLASNQPHTSSKS